MPTVELGGMLNAVRRNISPPQDQHGVRAGGADRGGGRAPAFASLQKLKRLLKLGTSMCFEDLLDVRGASLQRHALRCTRPRGSSR